jgi:hypothetical protein
MEKGIYNAELFFGAAVQLAQAAEVSQINTKVDVLTVDVDRIIANQGVINVGVKKSSLLIPHTANVAT